MDPVTRHPLEPDASFDGGDLDCGGGLLLLIRQHMDSLPRGGLLEIQSTETSVDEDLPAWCRMTGNELVSWTREGRRRSFLVSKGRPGERAMAASPGPAAIHRVVPVTIPPSLPAPAPDICPLAVMGIGSWPRPRWMVQALHERLESRLGEPEFQATADDAVRLAVDAQLRAGVDVVTDGEQRRDNYASFVGARLDNCQLIPLTGLLPLVDDPEKFRREMQALDVPASQVRHPAVRGPLGRTRPLAVHEYEFVRSLTARPVKIALPGPYLLTRLMWMECISDRVYRSREHLAEDVVRVLREELHGLLAAGVALVQLDEPVLSEVVFTGAKNTRTFMCGALSEKGDPVKELDFARMLLRGVVAGLPRRRLGLHVYRGNWTPDERAALAGDYRPLLPLLADAPVGTLFLELATPRAGEIDVLRDLPRDYRIWGSSIRSTSRSRPRRRSWPGRGAPWICSVPSASCSAPTAASLPSPTIRWPPAAWPRPSCGRSSLRPNGCGKAESTMSPRKETAMAIKVGDRLPEGSLTEMIQTGRPGCSVGPNSFSVSELTKGRRIAIFAVPGAFTPTCSTKHVPSYVQNFDKLKAKGVDEIWCIAVNDAFVMGAWGQDQKCDDKVRMMADGSAIYTKALGLDMDLTARGMGVRSQRYSMLVEDGVVKALNVEQPGKFEVSDAETMLKKL